MDELLQQILVETTLLSHSEEGFEYERFEQLVEIRQRLTDRIALEGQLSAAQKSSIKEILRLDPIILEYMHKLRDEAQEGLSRIHSFKKQKAAYDYQGDNDSFMFDELK
jgi:hypothetical protein